jgi:hypothetical protein
MSQTNGQTNGHFPFPNSIEPPIQPYTYVDQSDLAARFSFDCAFYRRAKRELLANNWDESQIFGRGEVDVDSILMGFSDSHDGQTVPTWAARMCNKILASLPLPIRLASAVLLTGMMRVR